MTQPDQEPIVDPDIDSEEVPDTDRRGLFTRMARGASERVMDVVDVDMVLDHVDINALLERVDINAVLERVDVDALMARVDVRALVDRAGIPEIVAESTGHLTGSALDLFRKPIVGIDEIVFHGLNRVIGRDTNEFPQGPGSLTAWVDEKEEEKAQIIGGPPRGTGAVRTGRYAGPVTRLLAVMLDVFLITTGFTLVVGVISFLGDLLFSDTVTIPEGGLWYRIGLGVFAFLYVWLSLAVFGKTAGKSVLGLRVVGADGTVGLGGNRALIRTLTFPISIAVFGLGLIGVIWGRERRAWHDHFAGSAVVYDWGSRAAQMSSPLADWLERRGGS
ncbi:MAG TPA: RDD family protein [Acidimicrobiia bacterium]